MRLWHLGLGFSLSFGIGLGVGCSATGNPSTSSAGGAGGSGSGTLSNGPGGGSGFDAGQDAFGSCAKFSAAAKQSPAAMIFVLDASASMNNANKWGTAQLAVVQAIDKDAFDTMSLGLLIAPSNFTPMPPCLCNALGGPGVCQIILPMGVSCGVSALAQVPLTPAGMNKSNAAMGVRHDMYQFLASAKPLSNNDDGSPIYDALNGGYKTLKGYKIDKRIAVLITDGGFSCTSVSNPARAGDLDGNMCPDWEIPDTVNKLINDNRLDPAMPINTFIVGVPGSDSHGETQGMYDTPKYSMKLALSSYAVSGSPDTVDPSCDGKVFTKAGADPTKPCHIDLSSGGSFNADALAQAITTIRGKALGCVYDLPTPPPGQSIDPTLVNVTATINGVTTTIPKRSQPSDTCDVDGCWDYNASNQVQLIGKTCNDVTSAMDAKVEIYVGCMTILK